MKNYVLPVLLFILLLAGTAYYLQHDKQASAESGKQEIGIEEHEDDDDELDHDIRQQLVQGNLSVILTTAAQSLAGIKTVPAETMKFENELTTFAMVIDPQNLFDLRYRYVNTLANREVLNTTLANSRQVLDQLNQLNSETTNISKRDLQLARSQFQENKAKKTAFDVELHNIRSQMIQQWNRPLTEMALKENSELFSRLTNKEELLVLMSLYKGQKLADDAAFVFINNNNDRNQARKAYVISPATFSNQTLQGETYFLRTNADKFRVGMRLHVWLPDMRLPKEGIHIPEQAVVWYAGQPWAYVKTEDELFNRHSLLDAVKTDTGWLVKENFSDGDQLVVFGAQTLLSEEFKWAIPDEDDD